MAFRHFFGHAQRFGIPTTYDRTEAYGSQSALLGKSRGTGVLGAGATRPPA